jgi:hypothetical protein
VPPRARPRRELSADELPALSRYGLHALSRYGLQVYSSYGLQVYSSYDLQAPGGQRELGLRGIADVVAVDLDR